MGARPSRAAPPPPPPPTAQSLLVAAFSEPPPGEQGRDVFVRSLTPVSRFVETGLEQACSECEDGAKFAVVGLGVFVCARCAGVFRGLDVQLTGGVRSLTLDTWTPELMDRMKAAAGANVDMEYCVPPGMVKPTPMSGSEVRTRWIHAKWVERAFARTVAARHHSPPQKDTSMERSGSFSRPGQRELVGMVDVHILSSKHLKKPFGRSRRLSGGFHVSASLEPGLSSPAGALTHLNVRDGSGKAPIHLSWDGESALRLSYGLGSGSYKNIGSCNVVLRPLLGPHPLRRGRTASHPPAAAAAEHEHPQHVATTIRHHCDMTTAKGEDAGSMEVRIDFYDLR